MDQVPKEIEIQILVNLDDKTRRLARLSCKQWFNIIDYRDFSFYLTKKSDWPKIVDRLAVYSKPISVKFVKSIFNKLRDISDHLLRLTNLTDLTFDNLVRNEENLESEWLKLTALPNLHSIEVTSYDYTIPYEALLNLQSLTKFDPLSEENVDNLRLKKSIQRWTNLQSLLISQENRLDIDIFDTYNTKVTNLYLQQPSVPTNFFNHLGNIKSLSLNITEPMEFSLKSLTALESLFLNGIQIHELNSTKLTFLELFSLEEKRIEQQVDKLANLKELIFDFKSNTDNNDNNDNNENDDHVIQRQYSYEWLTALTALKHVNVDPLEHDGLAFISTGLTRLQISVYSPTELGHVSRFVSLKEIYFRSSQETWADLSYLSVLTKLESLQIHLNRGLVEINFLSTMTNLTWISFIRCSPGEISLPNLNSLTIAYTTGCKFGSFERLPNLTELEVENTYGDQDDQEDYNHSFVSKLTTLKRLSFRPGFKKYDCRYFSTLTNLGSLEFFEVTSEDDYCHLSNLTKLTGLGIVRGPPSVKIVSLPTSLQNLAVHLTGTSYQQDDKYRDVDVKAITKSLVERLPNLYKYNFE